MRRLWISLLTTFFSPILAIVLLQSCGMFEAYEGRPDDEPVPQTTILRIELTPDTVATEDTVLIHCVIEDSLDERFEFRWNLEYEQVILINGKLNGSKIKWVAPALNISEGQIETFFRAVTVDNGSEDSVEVDEVFEIPIIKQ